MTSMTTKAHWLDNVQGRQSSRLAYGLDASRAAGARQQPTTFEIVPPPQKSNDTSTMILVGLGLVVAYLYMK